MNSAVLAHHHLDRCALAVSPAIDQSLTDTLKHPDSAPERPILSKLPTVSVVDDDASVRAATCKYLRSQGYTVQAYSSAEHFLQSARLNDTSCVIVARDDFSAVIQAVAEGLNKEFSGVANALTSGKPDIEELRRASDQLIRAWPAKKDS